MTKKRKGAGFDQELDLPVEDQTDTTLNQRSVLSPPNIPVSVDSQSLERRENFQEKDGNKFSSGLGCY
jgi:hypothetical protein